MGERTPRETFGRFSTRKYVVPFGRYVVSTEVEPPADEVLVGREEQRATLIDLLISSGRRGAYLVTGRRGTGKTSFVKHCVAEYEESVFSRFLRGNVGRGVWDRSLVLLFWVALLFGALIVSELLQFVIPSTGAKDVLPWIIFAPIGILLLYPCVYAKVVFETLIRSATKSRENPESESSFSGFLVAFSGILAACFTIFMAAVAWFTRGFGEPATVSLLIPILGGCYFFTQAVSFELPKKPFRGWQIAWNAVLYLLLAAYLGFVLKLSRSYLESDVAIGDAVRSHVGLGLVLLGLGFILRGWHQGTRSRTVRIHTDRQTLGNSIAKAITTGALWYVGAGLVSLLIGFGAWSWQGALTGRTTLVLALVGFTAVLLLAFLALSVPYLRNELKERPRFRPRAGWLLFIKALISIVIAVQLAYPVLARIPIRPLDPRLVDLAGKLCPERAGGLAMCESARFDGADKGPVQPIFLRRNQEACWLLTLLMIIIIVHQLENEWIIHPYLRVRENLAYDPGGPAPWDDWESEPGDRDEPPLRGDEQRRIYRSLAELTLPWSVYKAWLPVLLISINLGFDKLDHRQVIQAMLAGLRERYYRVFLAWNSRFANLGRVFGILVLLMLVTLVSGPRLDPRWARFIGKTWFELLNVNLTPTLGGLEDLLIFEILPNDTQMLTPQSPKAPSTTTQVATIYHEIHFRIYHVLLFLLFLIITRLVLFKVPLLPYRENLRHIEELLDSLSARTRTTSGLNLSEPARSVYSFFIDQKVQEMERDPVDPRMVELALFQILEDIQKSGLRTVPVPEITFVFDELDKLGTRVDPGFLKAEKQGTEILHQERESSIRLRALLSDLKNILALAPARFVFVGGRDLHDEWFADQVSQQPLLTSIFHTEIYLPSLLIDQNRYAPSAKIRLQSRTKEYLLCQYRRAQVLHHRSTRKRWRPSFGLPSEGLVNERFVPQEAPEPQNSLRVIDSATNFLRVIDSATGRVLTEEGWALLRDFVEFLTHRSMGNPQKLKELLASFIRPAGREIASDVRWAHAPCHHVLRFRNIDVFRIQLVGDIFRHLALSFGERMAYRDDKFAISIYFFTGYLFKFHRRSFSWSNLLRLDDLAHVHRLPDLRDLQKEIVNRLTQRFLRRMVNGVYAFRFRSDIANEIEYLSRQSAAEMPVFNFTLDESQTLKAEYEAALKGRADNPDLVAAMGELYELDQDFEQARYYYRHALDLLDRDLKDFMGELSLETSELRSDTPIRASHAAEGPGPGNVRSFLDWGAARLRLMLQIGLTFEHARDFERAEAEYRNCRTLALTLVQSNQLDSLKHMSIVFQPVFAEAWLAEKLGGAVNTSVSLVEGNLWQLRRELPFVGKPTEVATDAAQTRHANVALTLSQLHNKAADLFFFKGRQSVNTHRIREMIENTALLEEGKPSSGPQADDYLLRAYYHYAVGLHELRRYLRQRGQRLSISPQQALSLLPEALPDVLFRAYAGGVNDIAEATLARVYLFDLFRRLGTVGSDDVEKLRKLDLKSSCEKWLGGEDEETRHSELANWFGMWTHHERLDPKARLIEFKGPDQAEERLAMSLKLCLVGAGYFEKGGYPEDAGRELLQVCETVTRYLWWAHAVEAIQKLTSAPHRPEIWWSRIRETIESWTQPDGATSSPALVMSGIFTGGPAGRDFWLFLVDLAIHGLEKADAMFRESRYDREAERSGPRVGYAVGEMVPAEALTLLCSLGIAGGDLLDDSRKYRLRTLLVRWTGEGGDDFWEILREAIQHHRYPMINRLNGMKVLIDALILERKGDDDRFERLEQALEWTQELLDLNTQFDAPLHFTPLHSGTTCALLWLKLVATDFKSEGAERVYRAAQRDLHNSEEMYTMRRAYYEAINDLYYLYDDFNDRQIHFNHAIQMAGADLTSILKRLIDLREEVAEPGGRAT